MGTNQNVIEINGKKYNAVTGKIIEPSSNAVNTGGRVKTVDGFTKGKEASRKKLTQSAAKKSTKTSAKPKTTPATHVKKSLQKSQTLMRSAVKKPTPQHKQKPTRVAGISRPTLKTSKKRRHTASTSPKSDMISHFGEITARSSVVKKVQSMPVKKQGASRAIQTTHTAPAIRTEQPQQEGNSTSKMIEKALANATAHEHPPVHKAKKSKMSRKLGVSAKAMAISSTVLAGVLLGGFFAVQNVPNLSMRVASARAGFDATLPGYSPSGFSFSGPINHNPGQVTINYSSNTDDRAYELTQRASNWNSEALLSNFVVASNEPYQTYLDRGRTLYIYDGSNATWVDNGVWYTVEGKSQMTSDQLVRIAASM